ncbi:MAG: hypothetical protein Q9222_000079 [Ikaeria aurantiellina]
MAASNTSSTEPSRAPTPNSTSNPNFALQGATAEDLLKSQTVGLVHLNDFRKRRAEALEQKEREAHGGNLGRFTSTSGSAKKKRKTAPKGKLSFEADDEEADSSSAVTPRSATPNVSLEVSRAASPASDTIERKRLGPNANITFVPKAMTKSALLREAQTREQLRKEFLAQQEAVKATTIAIPFVFYDGTNIPGGACRVKKGDYIWLFLDRSRKVGAELGVGGGGEKSSSRREWARVGVDDLMLVRGEIIIPHVSLVGDPEGENTNKLDQHYDFYYFIVNKTLGHSSTPLFDYASTTTLSASAPSTSEGSPSESREPANFNPLTRPKHAESNGPMISWDADLEGANDDPTFTKVVDRRWYERNKHIFPASVWEEFDPGKDYAKGMRRDAEGNAFFFS